MKCLNCGINEAVKHPNIGFLPCAECKQKNREYEARKEIHEFITEDIKTERIKYAKEILQPYRNGVLSREYVDAFGTDRLNVTPQEVKNAKPVWKENTYYND